MKKEEIKSMAKKIALELQPILLAYDSQRDTSEIIASYALSRAKKIQELLDEKNKEKKEIIESLDKLPGIEARSLQKHELVISESYFKEWQELQNRINNLN